MAKLLPNNKIIGSLGNVSFKELNGATILQSKPGKGGVKQTKNTKKAATNFGQCSSEASKMVRSWQSIILQYQDSQMGYRFRSTLYNSMLSKPMPPGSMRSLADVTFSDLNGFEFNTQSLFSHYCRISIQCAITASRKISICIASCEAATSISWPTNASKATLCLFLNNPFISNTNENTELLQIDIPNRNYIIPSEEVELALPKTKTVIAVVGCIFFYTDMLHSQPVCINNKQLHPVQLLHIQLVERP
ncbi:hypothetical protein SAMN05216480_103118 [Pustulibacterium marinum]|uniref:Uncharacterized protein n=1 Tax=Pustulibacterium marinum TaxID=1224947 RepID=A0A1I7G365_9FLAO|nr:hypothetical protein [Pustulibacterium marinum]SFU42879.1 hypothetical protein SAMN05216480_103118 [Pustulibacterium marinum]